jgi:hypothetical protein
MTSQPQPQQQPSWFSPLKLLLIFSFVNLFVYLDRGERGWGAERMHGSPMQQGFCNPRRAARRGAGAAGRARALRTGFVGDPAHAPVRIPPGLIASNGVNGSQPTEQHPGGTGIQAGARGGARGRVLHRRACMHFSDPTFGMHAAWHTVPHPTMPCPPIAGCVRPDILPGRAAARGLHGRPTAEQPRVR